MSEILVLAGVNGAGKSSVAGKALLAIGDTFYNPEFDAPLFDVSMSANG